MSYCPNCGHKQICECVHCTKRRGSIRRFFQWLGFIKPWRCVEPDGLACGGCGLTANVAWWQELEVDTMFIREGVKSFTELHEKREREVAGG